VTLYDVLGTTPSASVEALHTAYRERARALHPDLQGDRSADQRRAAEDAMRELNAAWAVLSDPGRREDYDRFLAPPTVPDPPVVLRTYEEEDDVAFDTPGVARLARAIPLVVVLTVLAGIFVFTAFAVNGPDEPAPDRTDAVVGDCVRVQGGHVAEIVACGVHNDGEVVHVVDRDQPCPNAEQRVDGDDGSHALCLAA
jgi:DnaJ domain